MRITQIKTIAATNVVFVGLVLAGHPAYAQDPGPRDWLQKMNSAVQSTNYEGTVIRIQDGLVDALKVMHVVSEGVICEKVIIQQGKDLEIIRNGNEVRFIMPERKSVVVEEWDDKSTLFSTLPSSDIRFGNEYDVSIVRKERIAGRKTIMLAIRPHDSFRYGHRIWLDVATGFPLQTKLLDEHGEIIEQVKFADITFNAEIDVSDIQPSINIDGFRWYTKPRRTDAPEVVTDWVSDNLPPGFRVTSTRGERISGSDDPVTHMMLSDGLASVSVFVEPGKDKKAEGRSHVGASNAFSVASGDFRVTAVGEVPAATVEQIARSMQPR
jgi:sigma-E factor negative regulatory protein RseB